MTDMLVELIGNFITGSEATLNSLFKSMTNVVFFMERELSGLKVGSFGFGGAQIVEGKTINFNSIYEVVFNFAVYLLIVVFITKSIKIYFMMRDGDAEQNPIHLVIGMLKAIIVMLCFKEVYEIFVGITQEFLDAILNTIKIQGTNLADALINNMTGGIFTAVACLVLLIVWLILICQFIMKGIEVLVMRIGIPFATIRIFK